jgi:NAD(P)-dependent dehydrogenase (short-subunit alcohol dehydrogenase family)
MTTDIFDIQDRVVVITGGMGQLGSQFARSLMSRGARIALFDLPGEGHRLQEKFPRDAYNGDLLFVPADVRRQDDIEAGLEKVIGHFGCPHALINNAAIDAPPNAPAEENGPAETYPESSWDRIMDVNVKGVFLCSRVIGAAMARERRGSIINIASVYGMVSPDQRIYEHRRMSGDLFFKPPAYCVSKSALFNLTRYLATYWASSKVRVNTLTFGGVYSNQDPRFVEAYCSRVPLGRMAHEDEYDGAIIFLVSDASSYMTGSNMVLDGGWTAW